MAKFCGKCGAQLKEGSRFCVQCGAPVPQANAQGNAGQEAPQMGAAGNMQGGYAGSPVKKTAVWKPIVAVAAVVVVLAVVLFGVFGTKGYEKPIKYLEKGMNEGDIQTLAKAFPDGVEELVAYLPEDLSDLFPGYDIEIDVVDKEKLAKDEMVSILSEEYDMTTSELKDVTAAYILEIEMTAVIDGEEESEEEEIPVVKMDGKWVIPLSMFM